MEHTEFQQRIEAASKRLEGAERYALLEAIVYARDENDLTPYSRDLLAKAEASGGVVAQEDTDER